MFKTKRNCTLKKQKNESDHIIKKIQNAEEDGLFEVVNIPNKGRGIVALKKFSKGQYLLEYGGKMLTMKQAKDKESEYTSDNRGCYMFYFKDRGSNMCIDSTEDDGRMGRLINHSLKKDNCIPKVIHNTKGEPFIYFQAKCDIEEGTELLYDYGERKKETIISLPWLKE